MYRLALSNKDELTIDTHNLGASLNLLSLKSHSYLYQSSNDRTVEMKNILVACRGYKEGKERSYSYGNKSIP